MVFDHSTSELGNVIRLHFPDEFIIALITASVLLEGLCQQGSVVNDDSMAMQQEPIDWRYLPYVRPMQGNIPRKYGLIWYSTSIL